MNYFVNKGTMNIHEIPPLIEQWLGEYNDEDTTDERRVELERLLEEADVQIAEKCDALASWDITMKGEESMLAEEIKRLQDRKHALENRRERLRNFIKYLLRGEKLKTPFFTYYYMQRDRVIADVNLIPESFKRIMVEPKLAEIGKAIKAGEIIPGAHTEPGDMTLVIR